MYSSEEYEALRQKNEETYKNLIKELKQFDDFTKAQHLIPGLRMKSYEKYVEEQTYNPESINVNPEKEMKNLKIG